MLLLMLAIHFHLFLQLLFQLHLYLFHDMFLLNQHWVLLHMFYEKVYVYLLLLKKYQNQKVSHWYYRLYA